MSVKAGTAAVLTCHLTVGEGVPVAAAVKVAVWPDTTLWSVGLVVALGATALAGPHTHVSRREMVPNPPKSTSWPAAGSKAIEPAYRAGGRTGGDCRTQFVPVHTQVSAWKPLAFTPPKRTSWPVAGSKAT